MLVFSTKNRTINRMLVFLTENHNVSRILVFSTEIALLVICLIFLTENAIESHVLQQLHNKTFRLSASNSTTPLKFSRDVNYGILSNIFNLDDFSVTLTYRKGDLNVTQMWPSFNQWKLKSTIDLRYFLSIVIS